MVSSPSRSSLTATRRPFIYVPLRHHIEQKFHVPRRLDQYGAGRMLDFDAATPELVADMITEEIGRPVNYRAVEPDGAAKAATLIAELL